MLRSALVRWPRESHSLPAPAPARSPQPATQTSAARYLATLIATCPARKADHAVLCPAEGKADAQVQGGREGNGVAAAVKGLRKMADRRRHKKSWMLKWRTTGARRRMALRLPRP